MTIFYLGLCGPRVQRDWLRPDQDLVAVLGDAAGRVLFQQIADENRGFIGRPVEIDLLPALPIGIETVGVAPGTISTTLRYL